MRERLIEQRPITEAIADAGLEPRYAPARPLGRARCRRFGGERAACGIAAVGRPGSLIGLRRAFGAWPWAHRTSVSNRPQRTLHGHVHIAQACSPWIEKKMTWARPMRFSNGTY